MLKRQTSGPKTARKKKKGNATYTLSSVDSPDEKLAVEDVRVWSISTSEKTGRITASRRTLKHYHVPQSLPGEPSTSKKPGGAEEVADVEETGVLADSESSAEMAGKRRPKRKRVRVVKENDSVSELLTSPPF